MAIEDVLSSFGRSVRERFASPLTGGFVLAWSVCNWNVFVLLFSGEIQPHARVAAVRTVFESDAWWLDRLWFPLLAAMFYVGLYPWCTGKVQVWTARWRRRNAIAERRVQRDELVTADELRKLREQKESAERRFKAARAAMDDRVLDADRDIEVANAKTRETVELYNRGTQETAQHAAEARQAHEQCEQTLERLHRIRSGLADLTRRFRGEVVVCDTPEEQFKELQEAIERVLVPPRNTAPDPPSAPPSTPTTVRREE